ncbi:MAG: hypothetical protein A2W90_20210 [Bacteroidetes bacterium GWF2_42_66]|nr:MAG: hypothetical protein A2W92_12820 [Bacteroidetes bacterium GWA2_42_15]OFX98439.1 MAG: hypothetical protein A2W89_08575 [Bacteroidetes bacterium GWE2_42_39]OFY42824.1 MAG: hypothetical protein A2W90_20210 [Bacteroidetes bacterium GWF2_42_66]HBL74449.1 hypothetical protein [Prolixibacteraceae bacterium]HCR89123.1 hypothetical protein [Prolixibacteraceae bacterium]
MSEIKCNECSMRAKYDQNPKSFIGRFWRWHINFCPGWKAYMKSLSAEERQQVAVKYNQKKFMN